MLRRMTYILDLGLWHVGPFPTHYAAQYWAERHGVDDFRLIPLDDPAEAPARIARVNNPSARAAVQCRGCPDEQSPLVLRIQG